MSVVPGRLGPPGWDHRLPDGLRTPSPTVGNAQSRRPWTTPDNAGQPAGLILVYTNAGHRPDALCGAELPGSHVRAWERESRRDACATPHGGAFATPSHRERAGVRGKFKSPDCAMWKYHHTGPGSHTLEPMTCAIHPFCALSAPLFAY